MPVNSYQKTLKLVENVGLEMDSPHPIPRNKIADCEQSLGYKLPNSYKQFLLEYGFGGVEYIAFCGLIAGDLKKDSYVNAYSFTMELQKDHQLPSELLAIENFECDSAACILLSSVTDNECPVILWDHSENPTKQMNTPHILVKSFGDYFLNYLEELIEEEGLT